MTLGVAIALLGAAASRAQAQPAKLIPWHIDSYGVTTSVGTFTDISDNGNAVALNATGSLYNVIFCATSTGDLTPKSYNNGESNTPEEENDAKNNHAAFPLGFKFNLFGNEMTHFTVSAYGGVLFSNSNAQGDRISDQYTTGRWAVWAYPFLFTSETATTTTYKVSDKVIAPTDKAPAYYLIEGEDGNHVLTTQHDYMVGAGDDKDEWIFQFKFYEATGKIEFIAKELKCDNALTTSKGKYHRIVVSVSDYAATSGLIGIAAAKDPYSATYMNVPAIGSNHRVFVTQTNDMTGWDDFSLAGTAGFVFGEACTMRVVDGGPEEGRTFSFTPQNAPETVAPLTAAHYTIGNPTITGESYSSTVTFVKDQFADAKAIHEAGPILAVISKSETPDYTLETGTWYQAGYEFAESNGFKPRVLCNTMPKISITASTGAFNISNPPVAIKAENLENSTQYYIHLYRTAYAGKNAPAYSTVCHTIPFMTVMGSPKSLTETGLADTDAAYIRVTSDATAKVLLLKSPSLNITAPSGKLEPGAHLAINGSETDFAEVLAILPVGTNEYKVPLNEKEGCFVIAYSVQIDEATDGGEATYTYAPKSLFVSVGAAFNGLPGLVDLTGLPFGDPNWEYNGFNKKDKSWQTLEKQIYRDLPFGWKRTEIEGDKSRDFGIGRPISGEPSILYAKTRKGVNVITPPIVADNDRILVTFNARWFDDEAFEDKSFGKPTDTDTLGIIEYAIGDGAWQKGKTFLGYDDAFLARNDNGYYALSYDLIAEEGESFIGKKIRFRFTSRAEMYGKQGVSILLILGSIDVKESKFCRTVTQIVTNETLTTGTRVGLSWKDLNLTEDLSPAQSFDIAYKPANDETDNWSTATSKEANTIIDGLEPFTKYLIRVTANCGSTWGTAYPSLTYSFSTIYAFPFKDSLKQAPSETIIVGGKEVSIAGKTPFDRGFMTMAGSLPESGYASLTKPESYGWQSNYSSNIIVNNQNTSTSIGVREYAKTDWLLTPMIYVPEYDGINYAQTIRFKASSFYKIDLNEINGEPNEDKTWHKGSIGEKYATAQLFVLAARNGNFSMADTVATIAVGKETIADRVFELTLPLGKGVEGPVQLGFLFNNPNGSDGGQTGSNDELLLFEISDLEFDYEGEPCLPVSNLQRTYTTTDSATYTWEGVSEHYKIFWGLRKQNTYTDSAKTTEKTYTLTGLKDYTQYRVKVVGYCSEDETSRTPNELTAWFVTDEACHMPTDFTVTDITSSSATFVSTNDQDILTKRLVYLTPKDGETRIIAQTEHELTVSDLKSDFAYVARTQAVCGKDSSEISESIAFKTLNTYTVTLNILPDENAGKAMGGGVYDNGQKVRILAVPAEDYDFVAWLTDDGETLSDEADYSFKAEADVTYTAVFKEKPANEETVKAAFSVSANNGQLIIRNLKGLNIQEVTVYGLTGRQIGYFTPNSREDLTLPVNTERALLLVRVASEQGVAIYKVYLH